jgi:hypothetical protein
VAGEVVEVIKKVFVGIKNSEGLGSLERDIVRILSNYGEAEWVERDIKLETSLHNLIHIHLDKDVNGGVMVGCLATPNLRGFEKIDVHIYPRRFDFPNVDYVREFVFRLVMAVKDGLFILMQLASMNMARNAPRYCCMVVNMGKRQDESPEVETYKIMLSYDNIGYEISKVYSRTVYKINFTSFSLFKDFVNVILPEFLESRGEVRE